MLIFLIFVVTAHFKAKSADPHRSEMGLARPVASFCEVVPHQLDDGMMAVCRVRSPVEIHAANRKHFCCRKTVLKIHTFYKQKFNFRKMFCSECSTGSTRESI